MMFGSSSNSADDASPRAPLRVGGIVLCGGLSRRMGCPKPTLPFGDEVLLQRVVRILHDVVQPVVVVAAVGQNLPKLPTEVLVARDAHEALGPLAGLLAGIKAVDDRVDAVYATACDVPFLVPDFVRMLIERLGRHDVLMPRDGRFHHPLAAIYRTRTAETMERLIREDRLRPYDLLDECNGNVVDVNELRRVDPELTTLRNLNTPDDYAAAVRDAGVVNCP